MTVQIDQNNFGQKKIGTLLDRMIPIYKCVPPPPQHHHQKIFKKGKE